MLVFGKNVLKDIDRKKIHKVYIAENFHDKEILNYLKEHNLRYSVSSKQQLDSMVSGNHQGIVLDIDDYSYYSLHDCKNEDCA